MGNNNQPLTQNKTDFLYQKLYNYVIIIISIVFYILNSDARVHAETFVSRLFGKYGVAPF